MAIIQECGGRIYARKSQWEAALIEFSSCFKSLVTIGNPRAKTMLKYVIYASIFAKTGLLQLSYNETKIFADDNEIKSHLELFSAA